MKIMPDKIQLEENIIPEKPLTGVVTETPKKTCCKPVVWVGIGVIILLIIIGTVLLLLQSPKRQPEIIFPSPVNIIIPTPILPSPAVSVSPLSSPVIMPSINNELTQNWKTYTNSKYKYKIDYPQDNPIVESSPDYVFMHRGENTAGGSGFLDISTEEDDTYSQYLPKDAGKSFLDFAIRRLKTRCSSGAPFGITYCDTVAKTIPITNSFSLKGYEIYLIFVTETSYPNSSKTHNEKTWGPLFAFDISQQTNSAVRGLFLLSDRYAFDIIKDVQLTRKVIDTIRF